jgi:hypothetical protein
MHNPLKQTLKKVFNPPKTIDHKVEQLKPRSDVKYIYPKKQHIMSKL